MSRSHRNQNGLNVIARIKTKSIKIDTENGNAARNNVNNMSTLYNFNAFSTDSLKELLEKKEAIPVSKRTETMNDIIGAIKEELKIRESKPHNV
jgi:hypothetical protein